MSLNRWLLATAAWCLLVTASNAASNGDPDPLFQSFDALEVRIAAPFATLLSDRPDEVDIDGKFQYMDEAGELTEIDVGVRTRGRFRRNKDVCPFPPLRLNFKASQTKGTLFHKQNKVKLVTHCRDRSSRYEQALLSEFLAYRILNELTDISFRVRLLRITYSDTEGRSRDRIRYAFLIEHKDRLAKRTALSPIDLERTRVSALQPGYLNLISMFHYLIGNTDFSPIAGADEFCCHNHELLGAEGELLFSVPYDFDQAGLVNAPHASPNPRFRIRTVRNRLYRGRCANNGHLDATIALFAGKREAILELIDEQEQVDGKVRKAMTKYLTSFFETIDSPKRVQSQFVKKCL